MHFKTHDFLRFPGGFAMYICKKYVEEWLTFVLINYYQKQTPYLGWKFELLFTAGRYPLQRDITLLENVLDRWIVFLNSWSCNCNLPGKFNNTLLKSISCNVHLLLRNKVFYVKNKCSENTNLQISRIWLAAWANKGPQGETCFLSLFPHLENEVLRPFLPIFWCMMENADMWGAFPAIYLIFSPPFCPSHPSNNGIAPQDCSPLSGFTTN